MKGLVHILVILAAAAFVLGIIMKLADMGPLFGTVPPITICCRPVLTPPADTEEPVTADPRSLAVPPERAG